MAKWIKEGKSENEIIEADAKVRSTVENVLSDVILMSVGLNRASVFYYSNPNRFKAIMKSEKILRRVDDIYLIDSLGNILISDVRDITDEFVVPSDEDYDQVLEGKQVFITNNLENKTTVMTKLTSLVDTYLYISRNIDPEILRYLNETEEAVSFYYSVENSQTGIKITFAIIYIIVVCPTGMKSFPYDGRL